MSILFTTSAASKKRSFFTKEKRLPLGWNTYKKVRVNKKHVNEV